ncbi:MULTISPECIES: TetR/AcrR family transcriptional regulator [Pseudonocardia]|uniref:Transcriptional regulator AcuR n=2 Tax=Pseudonocardia TaxID=1847 RepID=A0A1Y2MKR1_PSEAH|nr:MULTISPECIES: TetR/AcrR family transcriptional regulator [Pseudonocardia]OSY35850.1 Transcriptional regulator AcuR [Pseudonocardia autotrophica]TDN73142.1 TetR family transcriptional regulator [Pseudonocardia autotrophica]BBG03863.1 TetR family transcriptional regulator [Pseudonocardia autotrophica]GEC27338.1 TetR family transcriptional regulator [Pseudonocardia saturnea]
MSDGPEPVQEDGRPGATVVPTRERIIRAAAYLFLARSFHAVGVGDICERAQARKGSFYHFFPSKDAVAVAVVEHHEAALWTLLDEQERAARGPVNKLRATPEVTRIAHEGLRRSFGRPVGCPLGSLAVELATTPGAAGRRAAQALQTWEARIHEHCLDAAEVGLLADGVDPDDLARSVMATMQGMLLMAKVSDSPVETVARAMTAAIDRGVRS